MDMTPGWMAKSLAGNDRGTIYVIKEDCQEYVFLLDQSGKTLRKNKKHIQVIKRKTMNRHTGGNKEVCQRQM